MGVVVINGLPVVNNRAGPVLQAAVESLDQDLIAAAMPICFSYWDTYGQHEPDFSAMPAGSRILSLVPRSISNALADKRQLARTLSEKGLEALAPVTFESIVDALSNDDPGVAIWFIKNAFGTAGRGMRCVSTAELAQTVLPENHVVQAGVQDLLLINGRKFTSRIYALLWNQAIYLYSNGFLVIHGVTYDPLSTDYRVQIEHAGFEKADSPVKLQVLQHFEDYGRYYAQIENMMSQLAPVLRPVVGATDPEIYLLLGIDVIFQSAGRVQLLEINTIPNFIHTAEINQSVNVPFFRAVLETLLGRPSRELRKIA